VHVHMRTRLWPAASICQRAAAAGLPGPGH
jgi:hypothetical protein